MAAPIDPRLLRASGAARRHLGASAALALVAALLTVAQAVLLATVIERVFLRDAALADVAPELIALVAAMAGRACVAGAFEWAGRRGAVRVMSDLRERLARALLVTRPLRPRERSGELATTAVQGVDALEAYLAGYVPQLMLASAVPVVVLGWIALHDLVAALLLAFTVPLLIVFMVLVGRSAQAATRQRLAALSLLGAHFLDVVRGLETLRAHGRDGAQQEALGRVGERYRVETMATLRIAFMSALVLELVAMLGTALVAVTVGIQLVDGSLAFGAGLAVLLLAPELYAPLREVGRQYHAAADGLAAAERIFEVIEGEQEVVVVPTRLRTAADPGREAIEFDRVSFAYPARAGLVLDDLSLTLAPGRLTALVGASGAGKSTVAALLLRLVEPSGGAIRCGGVDLREIDMDTWRAQLAWVPQRTRIFDGTIADNVRLADPDASDERVAAALEQAGAARFVSALPDGAATRVGERGRRLSAGEAQRIAVARAFVRDAPLLILDEPTAHLDGATAAALDDALIRLAAGRTTLLIAHRPQLAARADVRIALAGGRADDEREPGAARTPAPGTSASTQHDDAATAGAAA
ncbi:thiol reductant ABC exporter subunit CydD [Conexibacter sp. CPCC 206217]|uniref:thiol reductant ABC exporter subunit CydD n=1 Tax=Conexibacter sp. CPCC 206217 TaxID=3064574 RepID=UPI0027156F14|nr:thiol reductant ABC exporter subunit CydD [Conexibacter sp. CPCC 206217]MDO8213582.1 thiol reductant ABC exporter subunit CydD [Conexibacter sp. CPCC 206217]